MNISDHLKRGAVGLWELVSHYSKGGDVRELIDLTKSQPERGSAIFVLSEIYEAADPVWKKVVKYASDPDVHTAYGVLRIVHERAHDDSSYVDILEAISIANLKEEVIFAKVVAIINSIRVKTLRSMFQYSMSHGKLGYHAAGLFMLLHHRAISDQELIEVHSLGNETVNTYLCSIVSRFHMGKEIERILPPIVKENLALLRASRSRTGYES